jgi:hypothetical protein
MTSWSTPRAKIVERPPLGHRPARVKLVDAWHALEYIAAAARLLESADHPPRNGALDERV